MKIKLLSFVLFLCLSIGASAEMLKDNLYNHDATSKEDFIHLYNGEVSRFLIHLAHANWTDEIVKGHFSPEFLNKYKSGQFLQYVPYGQIMGFNGIYKFEKFGSKIITYSKASFEKQKVSIKMIIIYSGDRYLVDNLEIYPIKPNNQSLNDLDC